ncbi:hypothetical protein D9M69_633800 [compost metagenome]
MGYRLTLIACELIVPPTSVKPSGAARAPISEPTLPPAPPLLSMITLVPSTVPSFCPMSRPSTSVVPPAGKGTR